MNALERVTDPAFMNHVINDPSVKPMVSLGVDKTLDLSALIADPNNICLADEYGGFVFVKAENGCYDVHTQFLPAGRGKHVMTRAHEAAWYMFTATDCLAVRTFVASTNKAAKLLTLRMGFVKLFDGDLLGVPGEWFLLTVKTWARGLACQLPVH